LKAVSKDLADDAGASTVEAALGLVALVAVLVLCLAGITAISMQVRCLDAAREAARLAARGDRQSAVAVARQIAPTGAVVQVRRDGEFVVAAVSARSNLLPALAITAEGVSAAEPSR
jgi:Flp pilus assembly protein TadG